MKKPPTTTVLAVPARPALPVLGMPPKPREGRRECGNPPSGIARWWCWVEVPVAPPDLYRIELVNLGLLPVHQQQPDPLGIGTIVEAHSWFEARELAEAVLGAPRGKVHVRLRGPS